MNIKKLQKIIDESNNIVFFGGAGVSTASGIKDFRSNNGLYKIIPEKVLSHTYFINNFFKFYFKYLVNTKAKPNSCHKYLKELEKKKNITIITQNIDGLHKMAGSKNVIELHGSIYENYCMKCNKKYKLEDILKNQKCICGGTIRPNVVLYEENLDLKTINKSIESIRKADTLIVAGTSLKVYPAAALIDYFNGNNIVLINKETTKLDNIATLVINDDIEKVFCALK